MSNDTGSKTTRAGVQIRAMGEDGEAVEAAVRLLIERMGDIFSITGRAPMRGGAGFRVYGVVIAQKVGSGN